MRRRANTLSPASSKRPASCHRPSAYRCSISRSRATSPNPLSQSPARSPPDMPEGDTIFRTARTLARALGGATVTRFDTVLPALARVDYDTPLAGRTVDAVESRGKWLLMHFSGDLILLTHMLMSGSWHIYRPGEKWQRHRTHMRIVVETPAMLAVAFNVPVAEFHTAASLARREGFNRLGPAPLAPDFD